MLVLVFLGFGVLIGRAARDSVQQAALADAGVPVKVIVTTRAPSPAAAAPVPQGEEAPPAEQAPTPEAPAPATSGHAGGGSSRASGGGSAPAAKRSPAPAPVPPPKTLPAIKHVFLVVLSDQPYAAVFGPESKAAYLVRQLEPKGALLSQYDAVAHQELPDGVALISGQGPTPQTAADCPSYTPIEPAGAGSDGQVLGTGCVYPASAPTLPGQLEARHLRWRAYLEGVAEGPGSVPACSHPALGQADPTAPAGTEAGASAPPASGAGPYATYRNPFAYFQSLTASGACARSEAGIGRLERDLAHPAKAPSLSYIVPGLCHDAAPTPCAPGAAAGPAGTESFLRRVVPEILASRAYRQNGLLVITTDEAPAGGEFGDSSSCCGQPPFPNLGAGGIGPTGRPLGGGAVGALLLSPFIKGPASSEEAYNHFSLLATIEDLFGVGRLGYAGLSAVTPLAPSIFNALG
ncbi:MAG TPA: alkaline phosphatase family protein [Solirubrobacteraceae bacterium]|nr:alkaline phosphatase family protein [Solirubrobacteraceae bacterium]